MLKIHSACKCLFALLWLFVAPVAGQEEAPLATVLSQCRARNSLHGAYVVRANTTDRSTAVDLILDPAHVDQQRAELQRLLHEKFEGDVRIAGVHELPLSDLVSELQQKIASAPATSGCAIRGAYYHSDALYQGGIGLVLYGQLAQLDQVASVINACRGLMEGKPAWSWFRELSPAIVVLPDKRGPFELPPGVEAMADDLRRELIAEAGLHGSWFDVRRSYNADGSFAYCIDLWVDEARASGQRGKVRALVERGLGVKINILRDYPLPLSQLLSDLRWAMDREFGVKGNWVVGAFYERRSLESELNVVLYGRYFEDGREQRVVEKCRSLLKTNPGWQSSPMQFSVVDERKLQLDKAPAQIKADVAGQLTQSRDKIRQSLYEEAELHGTWLELAPCFDHLDRLHHFDVHVWYDPAFAEEQRARMKGILDEQLVRYEIVQETAVPLSAMVSQLQRRMETVFGKKQCWVAGAYYADKSPGDGVFTVHNNTVDVVLFGRYYDQGEEERILAEWKQIMAGDAGWEATSPTDFQGVPRQLDNPAADVQAVAPAVDPNADEEDDARKVRELVSRIREARAGSKQLESELQTSLRDDRRLHGSWIELDHCLDHQDRVAHYHARLLLDTARADEQRVAMNELLRRHLPKYEVAAETLLPLSELVAKLRDEVNAMLGRKGCSLLGAFYEASQASPGNLDIALYGRYYEQGEDEQIEKKCQDLLDANPAWQEFAQFVPVDRMLLPGGAHPDLQERLLNVRRTIRARLQSDTDLHGAWVEFAPCLNHQHRLDHFDVYLWLDTARAAEQRSKVESLLQEYLHRYEIVETRTLPLSTSVTKLRNELQLTFGSKQCWVGGAYYEDTSQIEDSVLAFRGNVVDIVFYGRYYEDGTEKRLVSKWSELVAADPAWQATDTFVTFKPDDRMLIPPRADVGGGGTAPVASEPSTAAEVNGMRQMLSDLHARLQVRLRDDPRLHGVWLEFAPCLNHRNAIDHFDVLMWLDSASQEQQRGEVKQLLDDNLHKYEIVQTTVVPLASTLAKLQQEMDGDFGKSRTWIMGAYYRDSIPQTSVFAIPEKNEVEVVLFGRYYQNRDDEAILAKWNQSVENDDRWRNAGLVKFLAVDRQLNYPVETESREGRRDVRPTRAAERNSTLSFTAWQPPLAGGETGSVAPVARDLGAEQMAKVVSVYDRNEQRLLELRNIMARDRALHGAWVRELVPLLNHANDPVRHEVSLILDSAFGDRQRIEAESILRGVLKTDIVVIEELRLPLSQLVEATRETIAARFRQEGCWVVGAHYAPSIGDGLSIRLFGKTVKVLETPQGQLDAAAQKTRIIEICQRLLDQEAAWGKVAPPKPTIDAEQILLDIPSPQLIALRNAVRESIFQDPRLHGVWFDLAECKDHLGNLDHYEVFIWRDGFAAPPQEAARDQANEPAARPSQASRVLVESCGPLCRRRCCWTWRQTHGDEVRERVESLPEPELVTPRNSYPHEAPVDPEWQRQKIVRLLDQWLRPDKYNVVYDVEVPLSQLVSDIRTEVERQFGRGCFVAGAYYQPTLSQQAQDPADPVQVEIVLYGRVNQDSQKDRILDIASRLMSANAAWSKTNLPAPRGASLVPVPRGFQSSAPSPELLALRESLRQELFLDQRLHGTWLDIAECKDASGELMHYDVYAWYDSTQWGEQRQGIDSLLSRRLGTNQYKLIYEVPLPLSPLVAKLRERIKQEMGGGCFVMGAYYDQPADAATNSVELVLYGHVFEEAQKQQITRICEDLRGEDTRWARLPAPRTASLQAVDRRLAVYKPSSHAANKLAKIYDVLLEERQVQGVWVNLTECFDHKDELVHYDVYLRHDPQCSTEQRESILAVLDEQLDHPYEIAGDQELPVLDIIADVNLSIESRRDLSGGLLQGAYFDVNTTGDTLRHELHVYGRVAEDADNETLRVMVRSVLDSERAWQPYRNDLDLVFKEVAVVAPSPPRGWALFSQGVQLYNQGRFPEASGVFRDAIVEAPDELSFRYWRIMSEIGRGRLPLAYRHMLATTLREPTPVARRRVVNSLESVQGSPRIALLRMELRAMSEFHLYPRN